ncbi:MAG: DUF262 domain-containing protein [Pedobacter sp.]|uniref:DUF262 domain-containing protein n=1 Tax=Pedobacter sp. TaxID=1411316 RepID=UPI0028066DE8|nr:DUF262 domain-containing protein [Pedobacter sp.]MDQ8004816.1 DUF262 domain-containing protein [Pedobacter sp.]
MKTYSLLQFLKEPINYILNNEEDYNFKVLASSHPIGYEEKSISNITIPIIQRDYAQGREDNKELREEFIGKLFKHLEAKKNLKLDFIYGSLDQNNSFLPLDGQQRLTTLFLLHWYIIKVETKDNPEEFETYKHILSKFSYETRDTSRRFFKELVDFEVEGNPKESIEKSYWFNEHFSLDPTISGALNTLETIHNIYQKSDKKGSLLESLTESVIAFYVLPMDQFKLTDDLYIKLNARGKVLSSFENFKADIVGFIKTDPIFEVMQGMDNDVKLNHYDIIANKFDNLWSDLFWLEAKNHLGNIENHDEKSVDAYFFRFVHRILINDFIINHIGSDINKNEVYKELQKKEKELYYSNFELYRNNSLITTSFIQNLEHILDFYSKYNLLIQDNIQPLWKKPSFNYSLYKQDNFTMDDRMIFDAINQYILNSTADFDLQKFKEWMRVVWNLISDPDIRSVDANKTVMTVIRNIAKYSEDIYNSLTNGSLDGYINSLNNIHKAQLLEEKEKATFILQNREEWEKVIHEAERHQLFEGSIGFLMNKVEMAESLSGRFKISCLLFNEKGSNELIDGESHSLMRYVISQFDNWGLLEAFNFISDEINWKTHLRRNETLKKSVLKLIELNTIASIKSEIQKSIKQDSLIAETNTKQCIVHKKLYYHNNFHQWMQKGKVYKLKWGYNQIFVVRPGAWYDKVMIDGFRNELITAIIARYNLEKGNRELNNSGFYWGETIDFWKDIDFEKKVTFHFDINNKLHIGLWGELNTHIEDAHFSKNGWKQLYTFDVNEICSLDDVGVFIEKIEKTINNDPECLIKGILNKLI